MILKLPFKKTRMEEEKIHGISTSILNRFAKQVVNDYAENSCLILEKKGGEQFLWPLKVIRQDRRMIRSGFSLLDLACTGGRVIGSIHSHTTTMPGRESPSDSDISELKAMEEITGRNVMGVICYIDKHIGDELLEPSHPRGGFVFFSSGDEILGRTRFGYPQGIGSVKEPSDPGRFLRGREKILTGNRDLYYPAFRLKERVKKSVQKLQD